MNNNGNYNTLYILLICITLLISSCKTKSIISDKVIFNKKIDYKSFKKNNILVGATLNHDELNTKKEELFLKDFKYLTPANAFKQKNIHPMPGVWNWQKADEFLEFSKQNNIAVRLHGPISPQSSRWAKTDSRTPEELSQNLEEFMTAFCKRYNSHPSVVWMDVVNETVLGNGKWNKPRKGIRVWENPWLHMGLDENEFPKYILKSFEIATKYTPNVKLVFNQNVGMQEVMWNKVKDAILYIRSKGYRVDGIGWQGHLLLGTKRKDFVDNIDETLKKMGGLIDWAHENNLEFHLTELDYLVRENNMNNLGPEREVQAMVYQKIFNLLKEKSKNGFISLNLWDLGVRYGKGKGYFQSIYDENLKPTPAYNKLKSTLLN